MKANELRIGNWVSDITDEQRKYQVELIKKDDEGFEGYYIVYGNGSLKASLESDLIEPVKLTPEIMLKCGFEKREDEEVHFGVAEITTIYEKYIVQVYFDNYGALILYKSQYDMNRPKYLHQLQNLIHAITGQELEVKL